MSDPVTPDYVTMQELREEIDDLRNELKQRIESEIILSQVYLRYWALGKITKGTGFDKWRKYDRTDEEADAKHEQERGY